MLNAETNNTCLTTEDVEEVRHIFNKLYSGIDTGKLEQINQSKIVMMKVKEIFMNYYESEELKHYEKVKFKHRKYLD